MEHLRGTIAFVASAREGSFTRAARVLDLSPQAVAASIARLEESLDVRLFNRTTRSIALTSEGEAFLAQAEPGLKALNDAAHAARDRHAAPSGLVRATCGAAFGRRYVMPLLPEFAKRYPDVRLDLSFDDRKVDMIREGYDVAIRGGAIADSSLVARRVCTLAGVLVASPMYLRKHGVPKTIEDLEAHRIVMLRFASGMTVPWEFRVKGKSVQFEPKETALTLSDTEGVGEAAVLGLGIARVSLHFAWNHLQAGRLKLVLNSLNDPGTREMVIHYPHRDHLAPRIRAFVEFLLQKLEKDTTLHASKHDLAPFAV
jgi:DNA-binding transcriptional LysR family regulator